MSARIPKQDVIELKKKILKIARETGEGHLPSSFSILDILYVLYMDIMKYDPHNPSFDERDMLVVSKGHAAVAIYSVLASVGFFPWDELERLGEFKNAFGGHPDYNKVPGIEASTGSLGHGFPMAVGMAMGLKIQKSNRRVFCIIGDGETNEGSMWEALNIAAQHQLDNLIAIFDYNKSINKYLEWGDVERKFEDFGWHTERINGHDHDEIRRVLEREYESPCMIVADTIKGFGCKTMEEDPPAWHHRAITKDEYDCFIKELS